MTFRLCVFGAVALWFLPVAAYAQRAPNLQTFRYGVDYSQFFREDRRHWTDEYRDRERIRHIGGPGVEFSSESYRGYPAPNEIGFKAYDPPRPLPKPRDYEGAYAAPIEPPRLQPPREEYNSRETYIPGEAVYDPDYVGPAETPSAAYEVPAPTDEMRADAQLMRAYNNYQAAYGRYERAYSAYRNSFESLRDLRTAYLNAHRAYGGSDASSSRVVPAPTVHQYNPVRAQYEFGYRRRAAQTTR